MDSLILSGTLPVKPGFVPGNREITVSIANFARQLRLDTQGKGRTILTSSLVSTDNNLGLIKLSGKMIGGAYAAGAVKFAFSVRRQSLFDSLSGLGFTNTDTGRTARAFSVPIFLRIGNDWYLHQFSVSYSARKDKSGTAKK
jgi:hypothetical protein